MGKDLTKVNRIAFICNGDSCLKKGAEETTVHLRAAITEHQLQEEVHSIRTRCTSQCEHGPVVFVHPDGAWYKLVSPALAHQVVEQHFRNDVPVESSLFFTSSTNSCSK
jgi:(2Fe-2S) ferredoxin